MPNVSINETRSSIPTLAGQRSLLLWSTTLMFSYRVLTEWRALYILDAVMWYKVNKNRRHDVRLLSSVPGRRYDDGTRLVLVRASGMSIRF